MKIFPAFALALLALVSTTQARVEAAVKPLPSDSIYQLSATLKDQAGRTVAWRDLRGRPRVVSMFYSSCPFMCPLIVDSGKAIEHALTPVELGRIGFTLVSLDPKRDTPRVLSLLAAKRKLDPRRWQLLQPSESEVRSIAGVLAVRYRALANGEFNHTSVLILVDGQGRVLARSEKIGSAPDPGFVKAVHRALISVK